MTEDNSVVRERRRMREEEERRRKEGRRFYPPPYVRMRAWGREGERERRDLMGEREGGGGASLLAIETFYHKREWHTHA